MKTQGSSPGCVLRQSMVINTLGDAVKDACNYSTSSKVRTWRILNQVITREFCYLSQRSMHCVHVDIGVLCDEVGHLTPFFLLQINEIKSKALLQN